MTQRTERPATGATLRCPFCLKLNRVDLARAGEGPRCGACARPILVDRPVRTAGEDLDRLLSDADVPVLVDFYADWCPPCKVIAPALDELARGRTGTLLVAKVDTDASPRAAERHGVRALPTLVLFRDGREVDRRVGAVARAELEAMVAGHP